LSRKAVSGLVTTLLIRSSGLLRYGIRGIVKGAPAIIVWIGAAPEAPGVGITPDEPEAGDPVGKDPGSEDGNTIEVEPTGGDTAGVPAALPAGDGGVRVAVDGTAGLSVDNWGPDDPLVRPTGGCETELGNVDAPDGEPAGGGNEESCPCDCKDPGEDDTGEDSPGEDSPGEDNTEEDGPGENGPGEDNIGEDGLEEDNVGEGGPGEDDLEDDSPGEDGPEEDGLGEDNTGEDGPGEDDLEEDSPGEDAGGAPLVVPRLGVVNEGLVTAMLVVVRAPEGRLVDIGVVDGS
jgi:hypothetical protein